MWKEAFLDYLLHEKVYSERTVLAYGIDLSAFEEFFQSLDASLTFVNVDADVVRAWMSHLVEHGYATSGVARRLSALRSFYKFLLRKGEIQTDPMTGVVAPKRKKALPTFVREADMNRLLDEMEFGKDFEGVRDRLIISLFYATGMRLAELVGLNDVDVDVRSSTVKVTGKRNKQRIIPFGKALAEEISQYLIIRKETYPESGNAFFINRKGERISRGRVYAIVKEQLSRVVTLQKRSPHVLRHTFATSMLNNEAELDAVKELLGHSNLSATEVYTHTTFEELKRVYEKAHPRA